jgi:sec-independent protein translocase protein TatB
MFDFDAGKLLIIGVIALIVIGPKELPRVLRQVGQTVGKLRRMAAEFQGQFMDAMKEADIQGIKEELDKINRESAIDAHFDPARDIQAELTRTLEIPATADAPALMTEMASPTADFSLPAPAIAAEVDGETLTIAAEGFAPIAIAGDAAPADGVLAAEAAPAAKPAPPARKRIIILPKRRPLRGRAPHDVSDRTRVGGAGRFRLKAMEP